MTNWTQAALALVLLVGAVSCYPQGRIVNGTSTDIEAYPFMVSLRDLAGWHSCGGTIISPRWIMTAAHCVVKLWPNSITVQYGVTRISTNGPNVLYGVKRIIVHEHYAQARNYANDIALLELWAPLSFNYKTIAPVRLPDVNFEVPQTGQNAQGILTGWGVDATGGYTQSVLQKANLQIYSDRECNSRHNGGTTRDQICAGTNEGGMDQCNGDSGGPLLLNGSVQLGIVSWSIKPCGVKPYPGVYTKVSHYIGWIKRNMN